MRKIIWLAMLILPILSGCVWVKPITGPDGTQVYSIECNGAIYSMADCFEKAGEMCGSSGYHVINAGQDYTSTNLLYYTANPYQPYVNMPVNRFDRSLLIQCK